MEAEPAEASEAFGAGVALARDYAASLADAGVVRGLIGPRETERLWSRHLLNSVAIRDLVPADGWIVDVGSGAGLPGIPLAIARPDCRVVLVEPLRRRTVYLAEIVDQLKLDTVVVLHGRAEDVIEQVGQLTGVGADVVTARAVAPLGKLASWCAPLLRPGGLFLPLKGASIRDELTRDADDLRRAGLDGAKVIELAGLETTYAVSARKTG